VLREDPTLGAWFRGKRGDLVEAWLRRVYERDPFEADGFALALSLCEAGLAADWVDAGRPLGALERAEWIFRGRPTKRPEHGHGYLRSQDHATACMWHPTWCAEALAFLTRSKEGSGHARLA
jgi:hypothetical protein